ncbi:ABC transporter substrate-binding protein [Cytobacillus purgationiresistens]|uniref:Spermidine/putrescine transport system substrate-binding protein n=1 Tax=Cytobacillus purgationiresistens TaxID=863449 RepID=A0ABU0AL77_9BACI|nr:ABC transporter substrate-binding protein [Cytobacillus purgationiresistens]MDQ0271785.1 putative spermidine/putrescine transport system substrate-binding protein [Cytobacillus purgationiresistens]
MKKAITVISIMLLLMLTACGAPTPQKAGETASTDKKEDVKTLTVAGNGGVIERTIRDVIAPKYKEKTGVTINYVPGLSGEILSKVELQKSAPQIDVAFFVPTDVFRAADKELTETVDESNVPNMKSVKTDFIAVEGAGAPVFGLAIAPAYNTEAFEKNGWAIKSWNDLVSEKYNGRTAFVDITNDWGFNTLNALAMANGGGTDNVDPGMEKAKELAGYSTTFYKNSTQVMPAIQQGAADITVMGSYVIGELALSGIPIKMAVPEEGIPLQSFSATLVKNTPKEEAALEFIDYLISDEAQELVAEQGFYPVAEGLELPEKYQESIGLKESDATFKPDVPKFAEVRAEWSDRWNKEVVPEIGKLLK